MKNKFIINTKEPFNKARNLASAIFYKNEFPEVIFKHRAWKMIFLESSNLFDDASYEKFISLVRDLKENEFFLTPYNISDYNADNYIEMLSSNWIRWNSVVSFDVNLPFSDFDGLQNELSYRTAIDSFLFSHSGKWGIYNNSNIDLMIIGFAPEIEELVEKHYHNVEDRIQSVNTLIDDVHTWAKPKNIENIVEKIRNNYTF